MGDRTERSAESNKRRKLLQETDSLSIRGRVVGPSHSISNHPPVMAAAALEGCPRDTTAAQEIQQTRHQSPSTPFFVAQRRAGVQGINNSPESPDISPQQLSSNISPNSVSADQSPPHLQLTGSQSQFSPEVHKSKRGRGRPKGSKNKTTRNRKQPDSSSRIEIPTGPLPDVHSKRSIDNVSIGEAISDLNKNLQDAFDQIGFHNLPVLPNSDDSPPNQSPVKSGSTKKVQQRMVNQVMATNRKRNAYVWQHVTELHKNKLFLCRWCESYLKSAQASATRLRRHFERCPSVPPQIKQKIMMDQSKHMKLNPFNVEGIENDGGGERTELEDVSVDQLLRMFPITRSNSSKMIDLDEDDKSVSTKQRRRNSTDRPPIPNQGFNQSTSQASVGSSSNQYEDQILPDHIEDESKTCSAEKASQLIRGIMEVIILNNVPFNLFNKSKGKLSKLYQLLEIACPGSSIHLPSSASLSTKWLLNYYYETMINVQREISKALKQSYGTIVFDGWENIHRQSVINVLLRTEAVANNESNIYFLRSIFPGKKKMTALEYQKEVESIMNAFGGHDKICAVTTDNTSSCKNARKLYQEKHKGVVGVNDQAHIADLLLKDLYKSLPWFAEIIDKVTTLNGDLLSHPKLRACYEELMADWNRNYDIEVQKIRQKYNITETGDTIGETSGDRNPAMIKDLEVAGLSVRGLLLEKAVMLRRKCTTRFGYAEDCLDSFIRSIGVLRKLVINPDFDYQFSTKSSDRQRKTIFKSLVCDDDFIVSVYKTLRFLRPIRRYLRAFDSENARISEVIYFTNQLEYELRNLKLDSTVLTKERRDELVEVFLKRRNATPPHQIGLIEDIHYVSWLLDPCRCPEDFLSYIPVLRRHVKKYVAHDRSLNDDSSVDCICVAYSEVASTWMQWTDEKRNQVRESYNGRALLWWQLGNCENELLSEFAKRTLTCSPSAMVVDRSFSKTQRIHTPSRSRLKSPKVAMMMFIKWNTDMMNRNTVFDSKEFILSLCQTTNGIIRLEENIPKSHKLPGDDPFNEGNESDATAMSISYGDDADDENED